MSEPVAGTRDTERIESFQRDTVGCKSVPDVVEPVGEIPVHRYNRPYEWARPDLNRMQTFLLASLRSVARAVTARVQIRRAA